MNPGTGPSAPTPPSSDDVPQDLVFESDEANLLQVADDAERILGTGVEILEIDRVTVVPDEPDDARTVGIRLRYRHGLMSFETLGPGESMLDAHRHLRARLVIDRLRMGFSEAVDSDAGTRRGPR